MDVGRCPFRTGLKISVVGHRSFGDIVMFKVVTEWRAWYSKTEKLYTDFNKLHNKLRGELVAMTHRESIRRLLDLEMGTWGKRKDERDRLVVLVLAY